MGFLSSLDGHTVGAFWKELDSIKWVFKKQVYLQYPDYEQSRYTNVFILLFVVTEDRCPVKMVVVS